MRDLEIRGAGNLLGDEQSGHVAALGFELYMQMLDEAVRQAGPAEGTLNGTGE
jgi:transcription-repair coupling factor (superfamily II helicase)